MRNLALSALVLTGCFTSATPARSPDQRAADVGPALAELRAAKFSDAARDAKAALALDDKSSTAAAVHAIGTYVVATTAFVTELVAIANDSDALKVLDHPGGRLAWQRFGEALAIVDRDLAIVAADPTFTLELCLACWQHDWDHDGTIEGGERRLFELEYDPRGGEDHEIPEGDPRRRPTFKFDTGDAEWGRAMIGFQRAAVELVLAYRWDELDKLFAEHDGDLKGQKIVLHLGDAAKVRHANELILEGLAAADRCRAAYLAETDDDREWVPNPKQKSHPVPLDTDVALFDTWHGVLGDVADMLKSKTGLSIKQAAELGDRGLGQMVPDAYLDFGAMLREPKDIVIEIGAAADFDRFPDDLPKTRGFAETLIRGLVGNGYKAKMAASPIVDRLARVRRDLESGGDTLEHKLRYLIWLN